MCYNGNIDVATVRHHERKKAPMDEYLSLAELRERRLQALAQADKAYAELEELHDYQVWIAISSRLQALCAYIDQLEKRIEAFQGRS